MRAVNYLAPPHEHEFEAQQGLPEALPAGERLLWQGRPDAGRLAREALHLPWIALYFALLIAWGLAEGLIAGQSPAALLAAALRMLLLAGLALGLLGLMAHLMARTTLYTLTDQRVVMRVGIVLSVSFNLPLRCLSAADLRQRRDGFGDVALSLAGSDRIAYAHLWPHARAWHLRRPQPLLRAIPEAATVAAQLLAAVRAQQAEVLAPTTLPQRAVRLDTPPPAGTAAQLA